MVFIVIRIKMQQSNNKKERQQQLTVGDLLFFLFHVPQSPSCSFLFHFMNRDGRLYYGFHFKYSAGSVPHLPLLL